MKANPQDMQIVQGQRILKRGYTTGTTATGAAKYSLMRIAESLGGHEIKRKFKNITFTKKVKNQEETESYDAEVIDIQTPANILAQVEIKQSKMLGPFMAETRAIKDSGDDPDVTHRAEISAHVSIEDMNPILGEVRDYVYALNLDSFEYTEVNTFGTEEEYQINLAKIASQAEKLRKSYCFIVIGRGEGVGVVTKKGLSPALHHAAINKGPRMMMVDHLIQVIQENPVIQEVLTGQSLHIKISVDKGSALAVKTFNPKLGIEGGISIIGTSGIVEPMSEKALVDTIKTELNQFVEEANSKVLLLCPGNYGQAFISDELGIDIEKSVKVSNYIGEAIDYSVYLGIKEALFVGHAGKLIKLAASIMNTHSSYADGRAEIMASHGAIHGASIQSLQKIMTAISIDEMLEALLENGDQIFNNTMASIGQAIRKNLDHRTKNELSIEFIVFTNEYGIIIQSEKAKEMILRFQEEI